MKLGAFKKSGSWGLIIGWLLVGQSVIWAVDSDEPALSRGDAIARITAAGVVKKKIGELFSWTTGYDLSKINRANLTPIINYVKVLPRRVPPDGRTILEIVAAVDDPGGLTQIAGVRADLSSIGQLANTMLVDTGQYGDTKAGDGLFTTQTNVSIETTLGEKEIPIAASNRKGWLALVKTTLDVAKTPEIIEIKFVLDQASTDGPSLMTLRVHIDNAGRLADITQAVVNLKSLGYLEPVALNVDNTNDVFASDGWFSVQFPVPVTVKAGEYPVIVSVANLAGGMTTRSLVMKVGR